jgi:CheY-like chemotaxis protein
LSRILIAEDERRLAAFLQKGLRAAGYSTSVRADGISAAASARDADFDLLILDLGLPGQDGFAVLRELRSRRVRMASADVFVMATTVVLADDHVLGDGPSRASQSPANCSKRFSAWLTSDRLRRSESGAGETIEPSAV